MESNALVIVALVGLAVVCVGLLLVGGIVLLRFLGGRTLREALGGADEAILDQRSVSPKPNLRAIAEAQDFDAALARHGEGGAAQTLSPSGTPPTEAPFPDPTPARGSRSRPRRAPNRSDEDEDDPLADFVDDL